MDEGLTIRELFEVAIELPPSERDDYLRRACNGNEELLNEVASLLRAADNRSHLLQTHAPVDDSLLESLDINTSNETVGPYRLMRRIGEGGMGVVYLALRADGEFRKTVAIKVMRTDRANDEFKRRFRQERQVIANLDHPNIAKILDGGTTDDGRPFYVMDYVDGKRIDEYCKTAKLGLMERIKLLLEVCAAVRYLHEKLIVHRDLKPSNILVTREGAVKLLDFGIAKVQAAQDQTIDFTGNPTALMTPRYASPEQMRGETVTNTSDVYSLGVILYELLTGRPPYPNTSSAGGVHFENSAEPAKPSTNIQEDIALSRETTTQLRRRLSGDLDNIVLMALQRSPALRYNSVAGLEEDLKGFLEGRSVKARPDSAPRKAAKLVRRNPAWTAAALTFSLLLAVLSWQWAQSYRLQIQADAKEGEIARLLSALTATVPQWQSLKSGVPGRSFEEGVKDLRLLNRVLDEDFPKLLSLRPGRTPQRDALVQQATDYLSAIEPIALSSPALGKGIVSCYISMAQLQFQPINSRDHPGFGDKEAAISNFEKSGRFLIEIDRRDPDDNELQQQFARIQGGLASLGATPLADLQPSSANSLPVRTSEASGPLKRPVKRDFPAEVPSVAPSPAPIAVPLSASSAAASSPPSFSASPSTPPIGATVSMQLRIEVFTAIAEGNNLVVVGAATNEGIDRNLTFGGASIIDDLGNTYTSRAVAADNRQGSPRTLNGSKVKFQATFVMDTVREVIQASQIKRLSLTWGVEGSRDTFEIWNIPIQNARR